MLGVLCITWLMEVQYPNILTHRITACVCGSDPASHKVVHQETCCEEWGLNCHKHTCKPKPLHILSTWSDFQRIVESNWWKLGSHQHKMRKLYCQNPVPRSNHWSVPTNMNSTQVLGNLKVEMPSHFTHSKQTFRTPDSRGRHTSTEPWWHSPCVWIHRSTWSNHWSAVTGRRVAPVPPARHGKAWKGKLADGQMSSVQNLPPDFLRLLNQTMYLSKYTWRCGRHAPGHLAPGFHHSWFCFIRVG